MFGSSTLEIAIGLIFIYLLLSLICTAANELVAAVMKMRSKNLEKGIRNLLNDLPGNELAKKFYDHPLIKGLYFREKKKPSYIPSRTFALALMDILMPVDSVRPRNMEEISKLIAANKDLNKQVKKTLLVLIDEAGNRLDRGVSDFNKVLSNIETWFNNSMERVAGWYKRKTQLVIFVLAILFTFALNIDTISIFKTLSNDSTLRASIVAAAQEAAKQPSFLITDRQTISKNTDAESASAGSQPPSGDIKEIYGDLKRQVGEIEQLGIPMGWNIPFPDNGLSTAQKIWWWITKFFGLILTVFAASLGAPFWFDILNKIISIRSTGKSQKEAPKPEKASPSASNP
jgi:hypothetical protein